MDFLYTRKDHPTADTIYKNVREQYPRISLGTVYRNLNLLTKTGKLRRVRGLGDSEHFDADISEHQHFVCNSCGKIEDLYLSGEDCIQQLNGLASTHFGGSISGNDIYFYGLCKQCAEAASLSKY